MENSPIYGISRSPTTLGVARSGTLNKRSSRLYESYSAGQENLKPSSRSNSPADEGRGMRQQRYNAGALDSSRTQYSGSSSQTARPYPNEPQTARLLGGHSRGQGSIDGGMMASLPEDQGMIRVISKDGLTKVVRVSDCSTTDEVMRVTLRKFGYREDHERNYCFWTLAGTEPDPQACRKLFEAELWRIIKDPKRPERNRLILRKLHAGEPSEQELIRAADIALEETTKPQLQPRQIGSRSQLKAQKILGESWDNHPLSPASFVSANERDRNINNTANALERPPDQPIRRAPRGKDEVLKGFFGQRPPSELITSDLMSYFPKEVKDRVDNAARLSMRYSKRLSKVGNHRLSVVSNLSYASGASNAPPMPRIEDTWLQSDPKAPQLRVLNRGQSIYRDSVASSMLEPLQEESPVEPNRKSYVSFDSGSDSHIAESSVTDSHVNITDPEGNTTQFYSEEGSLETGASGSLEQINQALGGGEDGDDGPDDILQSFLAGDSWDDSMWTKGALIGQGSFGSVYLALHAVTGELLAVKQVETPSPGSASPNDHKKKNMIDALKREIGLLRTLQHPNIVQYLGCSSSSDCLNIFLEYVPGGSVQSMLTSYGALREPLIRNFVRQIVTGLAYLHGQNIVHRDIKGANILVDNRGCIKISDFGISKKMETANALSGPANSRNRPSLQGSVFWMAPEVVKQTKYTRKSDIWSLGCLVVEMMTGNHPFPDCSQLQAIFRIGHAQVTPTIPDTATEEAKKFLESTFMLDDSLRPDASELLESPFLDPCT